MFTGEADYRIRPDGLRVLLTPIVWAEQYEVHDSRTMTAPQGMVHDGASIPPPVAFLNGASVQLAATLHDAAYRFQAWDCDGVSGEGEPMTRMEADLIILRAAKVSQRRARESAARTKRFFLGFTHWAQRWIIFLTVLLAGGSAWKSSPQQKSNFDHQAVGEILAILRSLAVTNQTDGSRLAAMVDDAERSEEHAADATRTGDPK